MDLKKVKLYNFQGKKIEENLQDLGLTNNFLDLATKAPFTKEKIKKTDKLDSMKI